MQKTASQYGEAKLEGLKESVTQRRGLLMLADNKIDVVFLATTVAREQDFLPVKVPIMRGILGHRLLLIHKDNQKKFGKIVDLAQLKRQTEAGFVVHWADMKILEHNNIRVQKQPIYENLFVMLSAKRFDYFPRGINEIWDEVITYRDSAPNLVVDKHIVLHYEYPVYFFVNKHNKKLAERIELGLERALKDGSFKRLFLAHHKTILSQAQLAERIQFNLDNPTLPPNTPKIDKSWWLN
ncbi:hypothetical protein ACVBIL_05155 [Shewanella sp. 125m-7]